MTARIETAVIVRRPRATVFERLARLEAHADWTGDAPSITFLTAQRQGVGTEMIVKPNSA